MVQNDVILFIYLSIFSPLKYTPTEDGGSVFVGDEDNHSSQNNEDDCKKRSITSCRQLPLQVSLIN